MRLQQRFDHLPIIISLTLLNSRRIIYQVVKQGPWIERSGWSALMKPLQMYYQCWLEVTNQSRYRDKWHFNEAYFRAIKAQFPTLEALGFNRAVMKRAISNCDWWGDTWWLFWIKLNWLIPMASMWPLSFEQSQKKYFGLLVHYNSRRVGRLPTRWWKEGFLIVVERFKN